MSVRNFTQVFDTASTEWLVEHNLGKSVISDVFIFDSLNRPVKMMPLEVIEESVDTVRIKFSIPQRGMVRVI